MIDGQFFTTAFRIGVFNFKRPLDYQTSKIKIIILNDIVRK